MPLSKRNRRGVLWILFIALIISYTPRIAGILSTPNMNYSTQTLVMASHNLEDKMSYAEEVQTPNEREIEKYRRPPVRFNPNDYNEEDWQYLGLSKKQAEVVLKFSERGMKSNEDLKKIFVMPDELFALIKDSTFYSHKNVSNNFRTQELKSESIHVEINQATQAEFEEIPGIGPYFSKKIVEKREALGGFISIYQLVEVWKFDEEKLRDIEEYITVNKELVKKIDINTAAIEELKQHPYISYPVANSIVKMKAQKEFSSIDEIKRSKLIDEELFVKIKPYLKVK